MKFDDPFLVEPTFLLAIPATLTSVPFYVFNFGGCRQEEPPSQDFFGARAKDAAQKKSKFGPNGLFPSKICSAIT